MPASVGWGEWIGPLAIRLLGADMNDRRPLLFVEPITKLTQVLLMIKRMRQWLRTLGLLAHVILEKPRADGLRNLVNPLASPALELHPVFAVLVVKRCPASQITDAGRAGEIALYRLLVCQCIHPSMRMHRPRFEIPRMAFLA